jgi:AcrR family transcriptional regulator
VARPRLTREQVVRAAVAVLDAEGVGGLNMRRLGSELDAAPTAVYWHVESKDELVVLAGDHVFAEIGLPDPEAIGWRAAAEELARGARAMTARHPWLVSTMGTHLIYGPAKARFDDHCLGVYETAGFSSAAADQAAAAVLVFVIGTVQGEAGEAAWRARLRRSGTDDAQQVRDTLARATEVARQFPRLRARTMPPAAESIPLPGNTTFEFGLRALLDGLQARLGPQPK